MIEPRPDWMDQAECKGYAEVFWPARGDVHTFRAALAICAGCPVKAECLEYALTFVDHDDHGVWGGTSAKQRIAIRRQRRKEAAA